MPEPTGRGRTPGTIVAVDLRNFMTYRDIRFEPGPGFNVVLGPNGSGKSSIVCAITIGLGGLVKTLKRQQRLSDLVNTDTPDGSSAVIVIELFRAEPDEVYRIETTITRVGGAGGDSGEAAFKVNGLSQSRESVAALANKLQIQTDNLCQFLPQDVVREFPEMKEKDIFKSTVRAVGKRALLDKHQQLMQDQDKQEQLEEVIATKENTMAELLRKSKENKRVLDSEENRKKLAKRVTLHEKYVALLELQRLANDSRIKKSEVDKAVKGEQEMKEKLQSMKDDLEVYESEKEKINKKLQDETVRLQKCQRDMRHPAPAQTEEEIDELTERIEDYERQLSEGRAQKQVLRREIVDLKAQLQKSGVNAMENLALARQQLSSAEAEHSNATEDMRVRVAALEAARTALRLKQQTLTGLQTAESRSRRLLKERNQDAFQGLIWLEENRHRFHGQVFSPVCLEITMKSPEYAVHLEKLIRSELEVFVCEFADDMNTLMSELRKTQALRRINVVTSSAKDLSQFNARRPNFPATWDFRGFLADAFDAPPPVKAHLLAKAGLHNIPLFARDFDGDVDGFDKYFVQKQFFRKKRSKYSQSVSTSIESIERDEVTHLGASGADARVAVAQAEAAELAQHERERQAELEAGADEARQLMRRVEIRGEAVRQCESSAKERHVLETRLATKTELLSSSADRGAIERQRDDAAVRRRAAAARLVHEVGTMHKMVRRVSEDMVEKQLAELRLHQLALRNADKLRAKADQAAAAADAEARSEALRQELEAMKDELGRKRGEVDAVIDGGVVSTFVGKTRKLQPKDKTLMQDFQEECPADLDDCRASLTALRDELDGLETHALATVTRCRREEDSRREMKQAIMEMRRQVTVNDDEAREAAADIVRESEELVASIDEKFRGIMDELGFVGEVQLLCGHGGLDFKNYGVKLSVKFRDADALQQLAASVQSGGEKSVATAAYMMALQELTQVPFRCVDEINQGMDERNERNVWRLLLRTAGQHSAQYFYMAPKFPKNLEFDEHMTVVLCTNGCVDRSSSESATAAQSRTQSKSPAAKAWNLDEMLEKFKASRIS